MQRVKALKPDALYVFGPGGPATYAMVKAYNRSGVESCGRALLGTGETD